MFPWPIDLSAIECAEVALRIRLPEPYRHGMARANGGEVMAFGLPWELCTFRDDTNRRRLARTWDDIVRVTFAHLEIGGFPEGAVVLAAVDGNALILRREPGNPEVLKDEVWAWWGDGAHSILAFESTRALIEARS